MDSIRAKHMESDLQGKTVGGWRVGKRLGEGKSAVIFRVTRKGRVGALKIFDPELVESCGEDLQLERINRELGLRSQRHSHLIKILDGGRSGRGYLFVVMAITPHQTLAKQLTEIPRDRIRPLISQVADAAQFLERLGLSHRDIKPDNIVVSPDFQDACLMDLGVLRPIKGSEITDETGRKFVGTHRYGSPEFVFRTEEDSPEGWRAVTFYQLGGVLHDLIMRRPLFADVKEPIARLVEAVKTEIPVIDAPDVDRDLIELARNALHKDPTVRLRLVQWSDFQRTAPEESTLVTVRDRILKRIISRDTAETGESRVHSTHAPAIWAQAIMEEIRNECINARTYFPPVEVSIEDGPTVVVKFGPNPARGVLGETTLRLAVQPIGDTGGSIELVGTAAIGSPGGEPTARAGGVIFRGIFSLDALKPALDTFLYRSLDAAQEQGRTAGSTPSSSWLPWVPE